MTLRRIARRAVRFITHNWPLKVAAIALATLLYAGLVASQDSSIFPGPIPVDPVNQPEGTVLTSPPRDVDQIRYLAPVGVPRPRAGDFRVTVDLANVSPNGNPVNLPVRVTPVDPRISIIEVTPRTIQVILDTAVEKVVPVRLERGAAPEGIDVGEAVYEPVEVTVRGASEAVTRVVAALVTVPLDPGGIDVDREIEADPIDANGAVVTGVEVDPRTVHVEIPLLTDKESRTLPVNPVVTGTAAPGFRVVGVTSEPLAVLVEGEAEQIAALQQVDTAPVTVNGATGDVAQSVPLALPTGIVAKGSGAVTVRVTIVAVTETRTYPAGLRLDTQEAGLAYQTVEDHVNLTLFGPVGTLDQLSAAPLQVSVDVGGLGPGTHQVTVAPIAPTGVRVVEISPPTVTVIVTALPTVAPSADPAAVSPAPIASPGGQPSASP